MANAVNTINLLIHKSINEHIIYGGLRTYELINTGILSEYVGRNAIQRYLNYDEGYVEYGNKKTANEVLFDIMHNIRMEYKVQIDK